MDATAVVMPAEQYKKRYGLIAAKIGATFAHKITIELPIEEPEYATTTKAVGGKSRTRIGGQNPAYEYGTRHGAPFPTKALPGATVQLPVEDITRLDAALLPHVKWICRHQGCSGKSFDTKEALFQAHPKNKDLVETAERDPYGHAHVYMGIVERAGTPDKIKDGKVVQPGELPTIILVSDEE